MFLKNALQDKFFSTKRTMTHKILCLLGIKFKFKFDINKSYDNLTKYVEQFLENQYKYPKDSYILFDCLHDEGAECIDAYSLFQYMKAQGINAYYVLLENSRLHNF